MPEPLALCPPVGGLPAAGVLLAGRAGWEEADTVTEQRDREVTSLGQQPPALGAVL